MDRPRQTLALQHTRETAERLFFLLSFAQTTARLYDGVLFCLTWRLLLCAPISCFQAFPDTDNHHSKLKSSQHHPPDKRIRFFQVEHTDAARQARGAKPPFTTFNRPMAVRILPDNHHGLIQLLLHTVMLKTEP
jgi:hypothetical protein